MVARMDESRLLWHFWSKFCTPMNSHSIPISIPYGNSNQREPLCALFSWAPDLFPRRRGPGVLLMTYSRDWIPHAFALWDVGGKFLFYDTIHIYVNVKYSSSQTTAGRPIRKTQNQEFYQKQRSSHETRARWRSSFDRTCCTSVLNICFAVILVCIPYILYIPNIIDDRNHIHHHDEQRRFGPTALVGPCHIRLFGFGQKLARCGRPQHVS